MNAQIARRPVAQRVREWLIARCLAPINIDGSQVQDITIDGDSVSQVTMDGDKVFGSAIPDSAVMQLDAQSLSGFADGDTVDPFPDQINSNNATVAAGSPSYQSNAINGNASVEMASGDVYALAQFFGSQSSGEIMLVIERFDNPSSSTGGLWNLTTSGNRQGYPLAGNIYENALRDTRIDDNPNPVPYSDPHIYNVASDSEYKAWQNDSQVFSTSNGSYNVSGYELGRNENNDPAEVFVGEVMAYDPTLSSSERSSERSRLATKWDITL